ncbi:MAG TPA: glycosyltransferase, partial [Casimicrobiaceae bacterium]|nr:glycosyltransferase [Casimicrobiaceae bacterium]
MSTPPRFSIVVPLYDCRDAGLGTLESSLAQRYPRDRFEVIAVIDAASPPIADALHDCDHTVAVEADFDGVECEMGLFDAGVRKARGDYLYFIEGHTVLERDALGALDAHLSRHPDSAIVCGRRRNHARTALGRLVGSNNDAHEGRARRRGDFTLGANCVIRRSVFDRLGGLDPRFTRFSETVLYDRARNAGERIDVVDAILCTHHNDTGFRWLIRLLIATGRAKARYYGSAELDAGRSRIRHPVYRWLDPLPVALISIVP